MFRIMHGILLSTFKRTAVVKKFPLEAVIDEFDRWVSDGSPRFHNRSPWISVGLLVRSATIQSDLFMIINPL